MDSSPYEEIQQNHPILDSNEIHEFKLKLEIQVTTDGKLKNGDCSEGLSSHVKRCKIEDKRKLVNGALDQEASNDEKPVLKENSPLGSVPPKNLILGPLNGKVTTDAVKHLFIRGMGPSICADNIHGIQRCSGYRAQVRLEPFEKQAEITAKYHGNANVRYAWLGSSKEAVSRILMHGLGFNELPKTNPTYGIGVHLASLSYPQISASYCDVDEKGVQHMVLCRVILGNMELVQPGSELSYPSNKNFDSGVNDLINPEHYIIWDMNMSTHIYPEYAVSFERPPSAKGHASEAGIKNGVHCYVFYYF